MVFIKRYEQPKMNGAQSHAYVYPHLMKNIPSYIGQLGLEVMIMKKPEESILRWWTW
jgi:hypothetical protein